jgi:cytochrome c-type biogenesis protein CcmE
MGRKLLFASLLAATVVLVFVFGFSKPSAIYSFGVAQFLERGLADETVRVRGTLVHGTLCKVAADCGYRFSLRDAAQELSVAYDGCMIPDTFRDLPGLDIDIVVEGERCQGCHDFKATQIMAKCPSKYEMKGYAWPTPAPLLLCKDLPRM